MMPRRLQELAAAPGQLGFCDLPRASMRGLTSALSVLELGLSEVASQLAHNAQRPTIVDPRKLPILLISITP